MKRCGKCKTLKLENEFHKNSAHLKGLDNYCKICKSQRNSSWAKTDAGRRAIKGWAFKRKYGISLLEKEEKLNSQNNRCPICSKEIDMITGCQDHDHQTNKVRGILCRPCNSALGVFNDDIDLLKLAIKYLKGYNEQKRAH